MSDLDDKLQRAFAMTDWDVQPRPGLLSTSALHVKRRLRRRRALIASSVLLMATVTVGAGVMLAQRDNAAPTEELDTGTPAATADKTYTFGVTYPAKIPTYDARGTAAAFEACASLPGVVSTGSSDSIPPGRTVTFTGSPDEQASLLQCLAALPGAQVHGPFLVSK